MSVSELFKRSEMLSATGRDFTTNTDRLLDQIGKEYVPATLPSDLERGLPGDCYDWCMMLAARSYQQGSGIPKYGYVEGWATDHEGLRHSHAWLTDGIRAFDPTWLAINNTTKIEEAFPGRYFGVEINMNDVLLFLHASDGYKAVIDNRWRAPEVVASILNIPVEEAENA